MSKITIKQIDELFIKLYGEEKNTTNIELKKNFNLQNFGKPEGSSINTNTISEALVDMSFVEKVEFKK